MLLGVEARNVQASEWPFHTFRLPYLCAFPSPTDYAFNVSEQQQVKKLRLLRPTKWRRSHVRLQRVRMALVYVCVWLSRRQGSKWHENNPTLGQPTIPWGYATPTTLGHKWKSHMYAGFRMMVSNLFFTLKLLLYDNHNVMNVGRPLIVSANTRQRPT